MVELEQWIVIQEFYNVKLVIASVLIAILGSYLALELNQKISSLGYLNKKTLLLASFILGVSVWSMHFIGMSAFSLPIHLSYNWRLMLLSMVPILATTLIVFYTLYLTTYKWWKILLSGLLLGIGISSMHYIGMKAINFEGFIQYNWTTFFLSIFVATLISFLAFWIFHSFRYIKNRGLLLSVATLLGLSVSSMHYLGMEATEFCLPVGMSSEIEDGPVSSYHMYGFIFTGIIFIILVFILAYLHLGRRALKRLAYQDLLTGLYNRHWVNKYFESRMNSSFDKNKQPILILSDVDNYKWINETFGYETGDELLQLFAHRLRECAEEKDLVIRYDGNQFLMIKDMDLDYSEEAEAKKMIDILSDSFTINDESIKVTSTLGVALPNKKDSTKKMIRSVEQALKFGKDQVRTTYTIFDEELHSEKREIEMVEALKQAVEHMDGFYLTYQPKIHLKYRSVRSAEVLLRWNDKSLGQVSPGEFIPIAEKNGLIQPITMWVIETAILQLKEWKSNHMGINALSINLSAVHFQLEESNEKINHLFQKYHIDPNDGSIEFEITESAVMKNIDRGVEMVKELKGQGFTIALDDFGTGLSSLMYLKKLPVDTLKLDKSFMDGVPTIKKDNILLEMLVNMSEGLGMTLIAEGIETETQHNFLKKFGSVYVQGYYYGKPMTSSEFQRYLQDIITNNDQLSEQNYG